MHTVELLLDPALESGVRLLWDRLREAGLPSLATHGHPTNRPHLTVATAPALDGLAPLALPLEATLGPVRFLGRAVVREVMPTNALRDLHGRVWESLTGAWPPPDEWLPHVSLALRVRPEQHDAVRQALREPAEERGHFVAARSYDTATRTVTSLP